MTRFLFIFLLRLTELKASALLLLYIAAREEGLSPDLKVTVPDLRRNTKTLTSFTSHDPGNRFLSKPPPTSLMQPDLKCYRSVGVLAPPPGYQRWRILLLPERSFVLQLEEWDSLALQSNKTRPWFARVRRKALFDF